MSNIMPSLRRMATIVRKELLVLFCNRISRFMLIVPPLAQIVIFGWAATMEVKNVECAYLNHDSGKWSREIIHRLEGSPTFKSVVALSGEDALKDAIDDQKILFAMVFDQEFSRNVERGMPASAQLVLDGRRANAAQIVSAYVAEIVQNICAQTPMGLNINSAGMPSINIATRCWFNPNLNFQWYFLPNLIGMISLMLGLVVTGLSVAKEREMGTFDQLLVSPATPVEIAFAKLTPGCLIGLTQGTIFIIIAIYCFDVPLNGSLAILYLAMFIFAFSAGAVGLMVSSISSTQQQAFLGAFTIGVPCILISGAVTPIINMPEFLRVSSQINPMRHFTVICQGVFLKDITTQAAMLNIGKILLISFVAVSVAIWMFKRRS